MKTELCGNCGNPVQVVCRDYEFKEMGMPVILHQVKVIECVHCGNTDPIIPNLDGLMRVLALGVLRNPNKLCGSEVRFLRKYVNKSAAEFARFLHVSHTHLSKIENDRYEIGSQMDKLVRLMVVNLDPRLVEGIKGLMELMPNITDNCSDETQEIRINPSTLQYQYT
jgi:DNA-binding transcriptional regulator YiaG